MIRLIVRVQSWPIRLRISVSWRPSASSALGQMDDTHALDPLVVQEPLPVQPEDLAKHVGVAAVRLLLGLLFGLDQEHLAAAVFRKHFQQPVVEAADL